MTRKSERLIVSILLYLLASDRITPSMSLTSPGVSQWTVNENSFGTQTTQTDNQWSIHHGDSFDSYKSYSIGEHCYPGQIEFGQQLIDDLPFIFRNGQARSCPSASIIDREAAHRSGAFCANIATIAVSKHPKACTIRHACHSRRPKRPPSAARCLTYGRPIHAAASGPPSTRPGTARFASRSTQAATCTPKIWKKTTFFCATRSTEAFRTRSKPRSWRTASRCQGGAPKMTSTRKVGATSPLLRTRSVD